jgi:hypothetical protein
VSGRQHRRPAALPPGSGRECTEAHKFAL